MKEKFEKKEARNFGKKNTMVWIACLFAVTLFIGVAIQPALSNPMANNVVENETDPDTCSLCVPISKNTGTGPTCKTCICAARVAVKTSMSYTRDKIDKKIEETGGYYSGFFGDIVIWILEGVEEGISVSGYEIDLDKNQLNETIRYWVDECVGPQEHNVTKIIAALQGVSIGVRMYLISVCLNDKQIRPIPKLLTQRIFEILSEILVKIVLS